MKKFRPAENIFYEGEKVPFFWGMAYYDWARDGVVYYLIPLNFLVRFGYWCMRKSYRPLTAMELESHRRFNELVDQRVDKAIERFRDREHQAGFREGWNARQKQLEEDVNKYFGKDAKDEDLRVVERAQPADEQSADESGGVDGSGTPAAEAMDRSEHA